MQLGSVMIIQWIWGIQWHTGIYSCQMDHQTIKCCASFCKFQLQCLRLDHCAEVLGQYLWRTPPLRPSGLGSNRQLKAATAKSLTTEIMVLGQLDILD